MSGRWVTPAASSSRSAARTCRFEVAEVGALDRDLRGDDDLPAGDGSLRVVTLHRRLSLRAHHPRVVIGLVHHACWLSRRCDRLRWHPELLTRHAAGTTLCPPLLVLVVGSDLDLSVLLKAVQGFEQPLSS
jgi:hypothetical protein